MNLLYLFIAEKTKNKTLFRIIYFDCFLKIYNYRF